MPQAESVSGCIPDCPHFRHVKGTCEHQLRPLVIRYLTDNPDATCPLFEEYRAEQMHELAKQLSDKE